MEDLVKAFGIYFCVSLLFIVIAFLINRKRLIKKYDLEHGLTEESKIEDVKEPINMWKWLFIGLVALFVIVISIIIFVDNTQRQQVISFSVKDLAKLSTYSQRELAITSVEKGFTEIYQEEKVTANSKLYEKRIWVEDYGTYSYEKIKYSPDSMGKILYIFTNPTTYGAFQDSLKQYNSTGVVPDSYKSSNKQLYIDGIIIEELDYKSEYNAYIVSVMSINDFENSINKIVNKSKQIKAEEELKKKEFEKQYAYVKYDESYLYETPNYDQKRTWHFNKGARVKCLDTSGSFIFVLYDNIKGKYLAGWVPYFNLTSNH